MEQNSKLAPPLNSADARHLINKWSSQGFFRVRGFGGKIAVALDKREKVLFVVQKKKALVDDFDLADQSHHDI